MWRGSNKAAKSNFHGFCKKLLAESVVKPELFLRAPFRLGKGGALSRYAENYLTNAQKADGKTALTFISRAVAYLDGRYGV